MGWKFNDLNNSAHRRVSTYGQRAYGYVAGEDSVKGPVSMILAILCSGFLAWEEYTNWEPFIAIVAINLPMLMAYFRVKKTHRLMQTTREELRQNTSLTSATRDNSRVAIEASVKAVEVMRQLDEHVKRLEETLAKKEKHGSILEEDLDS